MRPSSRIRNHDSSRRFLASADASRDSVAAPRHGLLSPKSRSGPRGGRLWGASWSFAPRRAHAPRSLVPSYPSSLPCAGGPLRRPQHRAGAQAWPHRPREVQHRCVSVVGRGTCRLTCGARCEVWCVLPHTRRASARRLWRGAGRSVVDLFFRVSFLFLARRLLHAAPVPHRHPPLLHHAVQGRPALLQLV